MASSYNALKLYKHLDNGTSVPFPNANSQIELLDWQYDAKRMGGAPLITATIKYPTCLDDLWGYGLVYVTYKGEEYILKQTPTSSYSNEEIVYKHEVEFISERYVLDNVYFYDVVSQTHPDYKPVTNSTKFSFFGDINEFVARLNASFTYSNVGYSVVVDDDVVSDALLVSFEDKYMSEVLQEGYKNYGIPFYFVGKVVHYGYTSNVITHPIKYGVDQALLSIQKTNANTKVVTRITGVGSADNIPYWYPNDYESKEEVEEHGGTWIEPQANLMPPIYRESLGAQRFYNALNNTYPNPSGGYYTFTNPYVSGRQREWKEDFEDIKPTIKGMTNANGQRIDMFSAFAYDLNDSDEVDADGNYLHPYFFAKLRRMDGTYGFNLFDHSIDEEEMTIAITGGTLGACEFVIGVDEESQKNPVQVDENGNLVRDADGNVVYTGVPQERQNDTQNYEVWVALRKDINTFGVIMPNATNNYKPDVSDTTFVILHIDLPKAYILAAEDRLKDALIRYMVGANNEHWNFSIGFSRIFFEGNPSVLSELNENARVQVEYNNHTYELYISSYTYKKDGNVPLPQITVELAEELSISENPIQQAIDGVRSDILNNIGGSADFLKLGLRYFLRKDVDDIARGKITFQKGLQVGNRFTSGLLGEGGVFRKDADDKTYIEADKLYIRLKAYFDTLEVREYIHSGGNRVSTDAGGKCIRVECIGTYQGNEVVVDENGYYTYYDGNEVAHTVYVGIDKYRCYFRGSDGDGNKVTNDFRIGDQAYCHVTNVDEGELTQHYYWRLIVGKNANGVLTNDGEYWIDLSNKTSETISGVSYAGYDSDSGMPFAQDSIVQLGNVNDNTRQGAIIEYVSGEDAPSYKIYQDINSFSLSNKERLSLGFNSETHRAYMNIYGDFFVGDKNGTSYVKYNQESKQIELKAIIDASSPFGDTTFYDYIKETTQSDFASVESTINNLEGDVKSLSDSTDNSFALLGNNLSAVSTEVDHLVQEVSALDTERNNILRNTSFKGDYESESTASSTQVTSETVVYSDPFDHWSHFGATVVNESLSASLTAVNLVNGELKQTMDYPTVSGKTYIFSLRGVSNSSGGALTVSVGGKTEQITLTGVLSKYVVKIVASSNSNMFTLSGSGKVMELMLSMGTISIGWTPSHLDKDEALAYYQQIGYLADTIVNASTKIVGGLVLTQVIKVGNYRNKQMTSETGGMSGLYNDGNSPFLWGGGTLEKALYTIAKYRDDPTYQPTNSELSNMANFVVTHGGRAILNDIVLRGYIYALGGIIAGINIENNRLGVPFHEEGFHISNKGISYRNNGMEFYVNHGAVTRTPGSYPHAMVIKDFTGYGALAVEGSSYIDGDVACHGQISASTLNATNAPSGSFVVDNKTYTITNGIITKIEENNS